MASTPYYPSALGTADFPGCDSKAPCEPMPVCPACGGLQTLCRPRFFAGQLLTDEDLNRLDRYMTEKNRLHNRYLHGWGVVCGLDVVCTVCGQEGDRGKVVVKPGYALSPCGNDIVVPKADTVDICALIDRCRPSQDACLSPNEPGGDGCGDAEEDWVLAVCYHEQAAREVAALRATRCTEGKRDACHCGCSGPCECQGQAMAAASRQPAAAGVNVSRAMQCEPTVVCETRCYRAYKVPARTGAGGKQPEMGPLVKRFVCCLVPFMEDLGGLPDTQSGPAQLQQWLLNLKDALRQFLRREGLYDCEVAQEIAGADIPALSNDDYVAAWTRATVDILAIALLVLQKCLCSALLPPCPAPAMDDCVPIATVTVARNPCRVVKVCNFSSRRFLLTWPNIEYWLSWTPVFGPATGAKPPATLRDRIVQMCCTRLGERFKVQGKASLDAYRNIPAHPRAARTAASGAAGNAAPEARTVFARLLASALSEHKAGADLGTLLLASMGAPDRDGKPLASGLELRNPGEFALMNEVLVPLLDMTLPAFARSPGHQADNSSELRAMRDELAAMQKQLADQKDMIDQLRNRDR